MRRYCTLILLLLLSTLAARANEPADASRFLILRNGQVLEGSILQLGDRYQVTLASGGELRVPTRQVEFCAESLEQAFEQKRGELSPNSIRARLELVEWCLTHRLFEQGASELSKAMYLEPRHPKIAMLERRLRALTDPRNGGRAAASDSKARPDSRSVAENDADATSPTQQGSPTRQGSSAQPAAPAQQASDRFPVQRAGYEEPSGRARSGVGESLNRSDRSPSSEANSSPVELDLSAKDMDEFVQAIQPFILNRCATNNCHGSAESSDYHLIRPPQGKTLVRGLTLRNLRATLAQIDRDAPLASPLLTVPKSPHGNASGPVYGPTTEAFVKRLAAWTERIANPSGLKALDSQPIDLQPITPRASKAVTAVPSESTRNDEENDVTDAAFSDELSPAKDRIKTSGTKGKGRSRVSDATYVPKDPFDPEVFNRKYHPVKADTQSDDGSDSVWDGQSDEPTHHPKSKVGVAMEPSESVRRSR
ncbi:MAG: hypothetical protein RIS70_2060 [Planctomycetota bacterium]